jgi:hypothetical protein
MLWSIYTHARTVPPSLDLVLPYPARALGLDHIRLSSLKHLDGLLASIFYCYILCLDGIHLFLFPPLCFKKALGAIQVLC